MSKEDIKKIEPKLRFKKPNEQLYPDWAEVKLSNLAKPITQKNKNSEITRVLTNSAANGVVDQRDFFEKDIANQNNLDGYYIIKLGDYVYNPRVSNIAPVGPISKNKIGDGVMSPLYTVFRFFDKKNEFYEQYFKTSHWHKYLRFVSNNGARFDRMSITPSIFMEMPVPFPSPEEQQKIASCLSSFDQLITAHSQKLEALKAHKKGLMQQLLSKELRFKQPDGTAYPQWKKVRFTDCCELLHGFQFREEHFTEQGIPIIKIGSLIDNGSLTFQNATYVDEKYKDEFQKFKLEKGDILMALTGGTLGKVSKINKDYGLIFQNYRVGKFEPKSNVTKDFIYFILQSTLVQNRVKSLVNEAAQPNFGKQDFDKIQISLPSIEEQQKITTCLSSLDELISAQGRKIEALKAHKKGLMQGLFPNINENSNA